MSTPKTAKKTKVRDEAKFEYAWLLYTQSVDNAEIAKKVGIAERTLIRWVNENDWKKKRAAANVTRDELVNKTLNLINELLEKAMSAENKNSAQLADQLSKLAGAIRNLDKQANVVDVIQVFMTFNRWLMTRQSIDTSLTNELIKSVNKYQDLFISERLSIQKA